MLLPIERIILLRTVPIFARAPEVVLRDVAAAVEEESYSAGETIFRQGELGRAMYVVAEGRVSIDIGGNVVGTLGERQVFGEMAAIDPEPRSATVAATEDVVLLKLGHHMLFELLADRHEVVQGIIQMLCERISAREATQKSAG